MKTTLVAGPLKTRATAIATMNALGALNHSVYSQDAEGGDVFFVERLDDVLPSTIFGYETKAFMARQYK